MRITLNEEKLQEIVRDCIKKILLSESTSHQDIWYRGYNSQHPNLGSPRGLWLVDNIEYAYNYAKQFGEKGKVAEIILELQPDDIESIYAFPDDFDGYDPSELYHDGELNEYAQELHQQGCKGYSLPQNDGDCIFLWDLSPIVSSRDLSQEEINDGLYD